VCGKYQGNVGHRRHGQRHGRQSQAPSLFMGLEAHAQRKWKHREGVLYSRTCPELYQGDATQCSRDFIQAVDRL